MALCPLLLLSNTPWSFTVFRRHVIRHFLARGMRVICASGFDATAPRDVAARNEILSMGAEFIPITLSRTGINPIKELLSLWQIFVLLMRLRPAVTFAYTIKPATYAPLAGLFAPTPVVSVITGLGYSFTARGIKAFLGRTSLTILLFFARHVFTLNEEDAATLRRGSWRPLRHLSVLNGEGIDTDYFTPLPHPQNTHLIFLMNARTLRDKGVMEYIAAAGAIRKRHPDIVFQFIGHIDKDNPAALNADELDRLTRNDPVIYLGTTPDIRPLTAACDVIVLPSYHEGIPTVLLEGASMGKPLIATDIPGCRDVIDDGVNGFLCVPQDADALTAVLQKMIDLSPEEREKMGARARKKISARFDQHHVLKIYDDVVKEITGQ